LRRPGAPQRVSGVVVFDDLAQRGGERVDVVGWHSARRVARHLRERRPLGRDERGAARERFERGHAEALLVRRIGHDASTPVEGRYDIVFDVAGADDVRRDAAFANRVTDGINAPAVAADQGEAQVGMGACERRERGDERGHVLARLERPDERDVGRRDAVACEHAEIIGFGTPRREPFVVDAVVHHSHSSARGRDCGEATGGELRHADDRGGASRTRADHAPEVRHFRAFMPLGMIEERTVVHGHDCGRVEAERHRVVRPVPHVGIHPLRESGRARLFPHDARRAAIRGVRVERGAGREVFPTGGVAAAGGKVQVDVGVAGET
jgi:hypothetical protein